MHIKEFRVVNFKAFKDVTIVFNAEMNILTGVNNSGKTTVLEALSLWHECFSKLILEADTSEANFQKGDWVLGDSQIKYVPFEQLKSVRSPNFEDIFHQCDKKNQISIAATLENNQGEVLEIGFLIGESGRNYIIEFKDFKTFDFAKFNRFFKKLPEPIGYYYASPIAAIQQQEAFSTPPQVLEAIVSRTSASVMRNRLYALYRLPEFQVFSADVSYVLFGPSQRMELFTNSDLQRDINVVFNTKLAPQDTPKDIALMGSGTIQIIEILLNLHHSDNRGKDMNIILLDEPDNHIHRDIQNRLMQVLTRFSSKNQIFITTHNEALIRSADASTLFHLEPKAEAVYQNLNALPLQKVRPRFSGIYPAAKNPIISAIGNTNGLDFINAIEADVLLFVEGEDDARAFDVLLKQKINPPKYAYWVLGGVSKVFENILHYKTVLSSIKNTKTLWEKSVLIIDRDYLNDAHQRELPNALKEKIGLKTFITGTYTFEATLLTDFQKFAILLNKWLTAKGTPVDANELETKLKAAYQTHGATRTVH